MLFHEQGQSVRMMGISHVSSLFLIIQKLVFIAEASERSRKFFMTMKRVFSCFLPLWCLKLSEKYILKDSCKMKLKQVAYSHLCLSDFFVLSRDLFALLLGWLQIIPERWCKIIRTNTSQCLSSFITLLTSHSFSLCFQNLREVLH